MEWGCILAHPSAPFPPPRTPRRQRARSHGDTHVGTRRGHHPVAPLGRRGHPAHRGAIQRRGTYVQRRPVPAGRYSSAPAPHAPHRPCSRATPGAGQLRRTEGRVGGDRRRHPTGRPPPGRRRRVPVGRSCAPARRAPHVYDDPPPPGGTLARRGTTSSQPSTTTRSSPTTSGRRSGRRRSAGTTDAAHLSHMFAP